MMEESRIEIGQKRKSSYIDYELCIFCQKKLTSSSSLQTLTEKGYASFLFAVKTEMTLLPLDSGMKLNPKNTF